MCGSLFILVLLSCVRGQFNDNVLYIDTFTVESPQIIIDIPTNPSFPITSYFFVDDQSILGGERDLSLTVNSGPSNRVSTAGVAGGQFTCAIPTQVYGSSLLQWDGMDDSMVLNPNGLGGIDFTQKGGFALNTYMQGQSTETVVTFTLYSGVNNICTHNVTIPKDGIIAQYILSYSGFTGNCDFTSIGAVEVNFQMSYDNILMDFIAVYGSSLSLTPTPSKNHPPVYYNTVFYIDDFAIDTPTILVIIPSNPVYPIVEYTSTNGSNSRIIGGERDLSITVVSGAPNLILTAGVSGGQYFYSTPNQMTGSALLQWDGNDDSTTLNPTGLGGIDFTQYGGSAIEASILTDFPTVITFTLYSSSNETCKRTITATGDNKQHQYILNYVDFSGNCNFTKIGAVEIVIEASDNIDILIYYVSVVSLQSGASTSITPTRAPSCLSQCPIGYHWECVSDY